MPITESGVDTPSFLEACEDLVKLFGEVGIYLRPCQVKKLTENPQITVHSDVFGSAAFLVVQNDMNGNIKVSGSGKTRVK